MFSQVRNLVLIGLLISCGTATESNTNTSETIAEKKEAPNPETSSAKIILFFGNSITAGYQLDMDQAFPALIQKRIDSLGLNYKTINAGLSGETSAGGKSRIDWVLRTVPDIFVLELGANDGLRGLPLDETVKSLQAIIDAVKKANPDVEIVIAGMMVPPNLGEDYTSQFKNIFSELAEKNNAVYIPFILENVAGIPELNLSDGIHPTPEGHAIVAETVWQYISPLL
ncbi:arylesterase [Ekhidna sp. To15]|uniref:arylesterase n=1 Tax=Ekhidna sp. To15 TaxID=3395267 RepID=UPI003F520001